MRQVQRETEFRSLRKIVSVPQDIEDDTPHEVARQRRLCEVVKGAAASIVLILTPVSAGSVYAVSRHGDSLISPVAVQVSKFSAGTLTFLLRLGSLLPVIRVNALRLP